MSVFTSAKTFVVKAGVKLITAASEIAINVFFFKKFT
ncbi:hypothetical protein NT06LI_2768, partial [Listeria innocua FSL J1-023]